MVDVKFNITIAVHELYNSDKSMKKAVDKAVERFLLCDWGRVADEDKEANNSDLESRDGHVLARYETPHGDIYINLEFLPPEKNLALIMFCNEY